MLSARLYKVIGHFFAALGNQKKALFVERRCLMRRRNAQHVAVRYRNRWVFNAPAARDAAVRCYVAHRAAAVADYLPHATILRVVVVVSPKVYEWLQRQSRLTISGEFTKRQSTKKDGTPGAVRYTSTIYASPV